MFVQISGCRAKTENREFWISPNRFGPKGVVVRPPGARRVPGEKHPHVGPNNTFLENMFCSKCRCFSKFPSCSYMRSFWHAASGSAA